ncbi:hypothetical protein BH09GEM1_BH09GEM1_04620 [soil metagenome]
MMMINDNGFLRVITEMSSRHSWERLSARRWGVPASTLLGLALVTGCDPCSGVLGCSATQFAAINGQMVTSVEGNGVAGVRIAVIRPATAETLTTVSSSEGYWRAALASVPDEGVDVKVVVTVADGSSYAVNGVHLVAQQRRGESTVLPPWVTQPYFPDVGELFPADRPDLRVGGAKVEFRRTGGIAIYGPGVTNDIVSSTSDASGRIPLLAVGRPTVFSPSVGDVIGDLLIRVSATDSALVPSVHARSTQVYAAESAVQRIAVRIAGH